MFDGSAWLDLTRTDRLRDVLRAEGVGFNAYGHAEPAQRITTEELAHITGINPDDFPEPQPDLLAEPALDCGMAS